MAFLRLPAPYERRVRPIAVCVAIAVTPAGCGGSSVPSYESNLSRARQDVAAHGAAACTVAALGGLTPDERRAWTDACIEAGLRAGIFSSSYTAADERLVAAYAAAWRSADAYAPRLVGSTCSDEALARQLTAATAMHDVCVRHGYRSDAYSEVHAWIEAYWSWASRAAAAVARDRASACDGTTLARLYAPRHTDVDVAVHVAWREACAPPAGSPSTFLTAVHVVLLGE